MSRHYGLIMRVHCIRSIYRTLLPLMQENEKLYQLPGSELLLVLSGPETEGRLQHMVNILNSRQNSLEQYRAGYGLWCCLGAF